MPVVLQTSPFDQVFGLPVHPLVVHAAVVLLPLAAVGVIVCVLVPPLRRRFGGVTVLLLAAGAASAFVARLSGELLAERVEKPQEHAFWGGILPWVALALLVAAAIWWAAGNAADRKARTTTTGANASGSSASTTPSIGRPGNPVGTISGGIAAILALAVVGMTVVVGHSGATAVWGDLAAGPVVTPTATPTPTATATPTTPPASASASASPTPTTVTPTTGLPTPSASTPGGRYTLAEVQQHDSTASCWAVVDGTVYDLTDWISRHPGGAQRILGLCGRDASADFAAQHSSDALPNETIASFRIGELAR